METLLHEVGSNVGWAAALALGATLAGPPLRQRPALVHGLWVLVLLKLITPSFVHFAATRAVIPARVEPSVLPTPTDVPGIPFEPGPSVDKVSVTFKEPARLAALEQPDKGERTSFWPWSWQQALASVWLAGVTVWGLLVGLQVHRFRRLIQAARAAPDELRSRTAALAARVGLRRVPTVWLAPIGVPPMVWAPIGPPRLLLPAQLWDQFDDRQQEAILIHELAHLRRRDHWVRWLETLVLGLYWWNPLAWWARRQVEQAEEQCCDSWVLWALPDAAEAYAEAIVTTAVFLSGRRTPWPVRATGAGRIPPLRKRLKMIMRRSATNPMARMAPQAALAIGVASLFVMPAWAPGRSLPSPAPAVTAQASPSTSPAVPQEPKSQVATRAPRPRSVPDPLDIPAGDEPKVPVGRPLVGRVRDGEDLVGRVEADRSFEIRARVSGSLVNVDYGGEKTVDKGTPLFTVDPRPYQIEVNKAEAEVNRAEIQLKKRAALLENTRSLQKRAVTSQQEVDLFEAERDEAQAALRSAQATRDLARLNLEFTKITAPIRGKVSRPRLGVGELVAAGTTVLATIETSDPMYVVFDIPENTVLEFARARRQAQSTASVMSGLPVLMSLTDEEDFWRRCTVDPEDLRIDRNTRTFRCRASLPNPDGMLLPGLSCFVRLNASEPSKTLLVANSALRGEQGKSYLYVVSEQGIVEHRQVTVGHLHHSLVEVTEGLKGDDWVVVDLSKSGPLNTGMRVKTEKVPMLFRRSR